MKEAEVLRHANLVRKLEKKLDFAERKVTKAERALSKVEETLEPADSVDDPQSLTDEERFMFRKLGLRMKAFLLLGRRGIFQVKNIALALDAESRGVLVSVDKISKGYAIIVFRGRDYKRPSLLRPKNLLTKRKALARSIELQRREEQVAAVKDRGNEELYSKLDSAYAGEDEDNEEEDESYLETYDSENDMVDENNESVHNAYLEINFPYDNQDESETEFADP